MAKTKKISPKSIKIILVVLVVIIGLVLRFTLFKKPDVDSQIPVVKQAQPLSIEEMPLILLSPKEQGRELLLQAKGVKDVDSLEYELIYELEDGLTRGASGEIELAQKEGEKNILLGTCSRGTCKYDEGVTGGELTISLKRGNKLRSFKTIFSFWDGTKTEQSSDGKLAIKFINGKTTKYILLEGGGLPKSTDQEIISGPYNFTSESGKEKIEITLNGDGRLLFWDESEWIEIEDLKSVSLGTYIIVK